MKLGEGYMRTLYCICGSSLNIQLFPSKTNEGKIHDLSKRWDRYFFYSVEKTYNLHLPAL